ncbi:FitA-like ribbon-helix-helix domain-containing protein [Methylocaldum marinum]|uniref:FitA-like ribbon-helix-helix domain-containing protein n=1 Tax=Methylocaldum marinum TaxID=1432792 RepID=UPI0038CBF422
MPGITLKNIPDTLYQRLVDIARQHHRSLTKEILFALERHVQQPSHDKTELLQRIRLRVCVARPLSANPIGNGRQESGACVSGTGGSNRPVPRYNGPVKY